jgi:uncharacterized protein YjbJ (UPF0337 family)
MLSEEHIKGKWREIKGGVRNLWARVTDEEIEATQGDFGQLAGLVERKYGESHESVQEKLRRLLDSFDNDTDRAEAEHHFAAESSYMRNPTAEPGPAEDAEGGIDYEAREKRDFDHDRNARH